MNASQASFNESDVITMAKTIYGEARGEQMEGQIAVGWVIKNRASAAHRRAHFGDGTPRSACLAPFQFSCWNSSDPNSAVLRRMKSSDPKLRPFITLARSVLQGTDPDPTYGATHYYALSIALPRWAIGKAPTTTIGQHRFFANIA